jgi:hypothetical protein
MIVYTESGARYEIDEEHDPPRARKLGGTETEMTADGDWRTMVGLAFEPRVGLPLVLVWDAPGILAGIRGTKTTPVVRVEP